MHELRLDERSGGHDHRDHRRKHVALWLAVGGTMAVVVTLWAFILPVQLQDSRVAGFKNAARWYSARIGEDGVPKPTFQEVLEDQRDQLERWVEAERASGGGREASASIEELKAKIQAASDRNGSAPAPTNVNAQ